MQVTTALLLMFWPWGIGALRTWRLSDSAATADTRKGSPQECSGASNDSIERNEDLWFRSDSTSFVLVGPSVQDVQGLVSDYKEVPAEAYYQGACFC